MFPISASQPSVCCICSTTWSPVARHGPDVPEPGTTDEHAFALTQEGASLLEDYSERQDVSALERAEQRLREAMAHDPGSPFALFLHAVALEYLGDHRDAVAEFSLLRERHPDFQSSEVIYNLATSHLTTYTDEGYGEAVPLFEQLAQLDRPPIIRALALASLATAYAQMAANAEHANTDRELRDLVVLTDRNSSLADAVAAELDHKDRKVREARWLAANARGVARMSLGRHLHRHLDARTAAQGEFDAADREFDGALRIDPGNLDVLSNRGTLLLYRWQSEPDERPDLLITASQMYQRVVAGRPYINYGYYRLGQIERRLGRFTEAVASLQKALDARYLEIEPDIIRKELRAAQSWDRRSDAS